MKGEAGMATGVPLLPSKLRTRTFVGDLNPPTSLDAAVEAISVREGQIRHSRALFNLNSLQNRIE